MIEIKIVEGSPGIRTPYSCESTSAQVHKSDPQFPDQEQTLHRPLYPKTSYCLLDGKITPHPVMKKV